MLSEIADILELTGGSPFKVRAYRQAAQVVDTLPGPIAELWRRDELTRLPSVGTSIAGKIGELLSRGTCAEHERLAKKVPPGILELLRLESVGPKTVAAVWKTLGVTDLEGLERAAKTGHLLEVPRMGPGRVKAIRKAIDRHRARVGRTPLHRAAHFAERLIERLQKVPGVERVEAAGSLRRRRETVGDIDLLVAAEQARPVMRAFVNLPEVGSVLAEGPTKTSVRLKIGLQVDLRVLPLESFGAAMHYFTGSKSHNIALRTRAVRRGLKVSEYGIFDREGHRLGGEREEDVFRLVELPWIPPELREGAGEIDAAENGRLPKLVREEDLRGDLHIHTDASSDGRSSLEEIAEAARRLGREYVAITEHSRSRPLGLDEDGLIRHAARIRALDRKLKGKPRLLAGIEVDILHDGSLDLDEAVLAELDWVVASIHSHFSDPPRTITARMIRAIRSGVVDVIGHPSGRKIGKRDPYEFDLEAVLEAAAEMGVAMEVNAQPDRLDLADKACRLAKQAGVKVVISSDAHLASHLENLRYGVWIARRGWLEKDDVLNTRAVDRLRQRQRRMKIHERPGLEGR